MKVKCELKPALMYDKLQKNSDRWHRSFVGSIYPKMIQHLYLGTMTMKTLVVITQYCIYFLCVYSTQHTWFVQKVSGLTTVHEVDKAYGVLTLIVFNIVPLRSYTLRPTFLPLFETFCELLFRDV